ncbi:MAG: glycosyltransferase [Pseudomonadota bacterium]
MRSSSQSRRLLFIVNDAGFFGSHRLPIALEAQRQGYHVALACPDDEKARAVAAKGVELVPISLARGGLNPTGEVRALIELDRLMDSHKPDLVHLITSKPIIYGGLVTRRRHIPAVAAVSGLGHVFIDDGLKARALRQAALLGYRAAMARPGLFPIFQNRDNLALFQKARAIHEAPTLIRGSGTDVSRFDPSPAANGVPRLVLPARMLYAKGVSEFVEAARILKNESVAAEFRLVGDPDPANPASIPIKQLQAWDAEGVVRWEPYRADIEQVLKESDVVVLPSTMKASQRRLSMRLLRAGPS